MNNQINFDPAYVECSGKIIVCAREIEKLLRRLGAASNGSIHDQTNEISAKLSPELQQKLHFIASIRNQTAHGDESFSPDKLPDDFFTTAQKVIAELQLLVDGSNTTESPVISSAPATPAAPVRRQPLSEINPAALNEEEYKEYLSRQQFAKFSLCMKISAALPILNSIYFLVLILGGFIGGYLLLLQIIFFAMGMLFIVGGFTRQEHSLFILGGVFLFVIYVLSCFAHGNEKIPHRIKPMRFVPILNIIYLLVKFYQSISKTMILGGVTLLALNAGTVLLLLRQQYKPAAVLCGIAYLAGIITIICHKKLHNNN
ncbi:MAG: hypothetical protein MST10_03800 [Lentisphaeria bacterium]|nr:hypothetical protein [Lentisphaeria bacterium]